MHLQVVRLEIGVLTPNQGRDIKRDVVAAGVQVGMGGIRFVARSPSPKNIRFEKSTWILGFQIGRRQEHAVRGVEVNTAGIGV